MGKLKIVEQKAKPKVQRKNLYFFLISLSGFSMGLVTWSSRWAMSIPSVVDYGCILVNS